MGSAKFPTITQVSRKSGSKQRPTPATFHKIILRTGEKYCSAVHADLINIASCGDEMINDMRRIKMVEIEVHAK